MQMYTDDMPAATPRSMSVCIVSTPVPFSKFWLLLGKTQHFSIAEFAGLSLQTAMFATMQGLKMNIQIRCMKT